MSRIERYQESINNFIKTKEMFTPEIKEILLNNSQRINIIKNDDLLNSYDMQFNLFIIDKYLIWNWKGSLIFFNH